MDDIHGHILVNATVIYMFITYKITFNAASCINSLLESLHIAGTVITHSKSVQQKSLYGSVSKYL